MRITFSFTSSTNIFLPAKSRKQTLLLGGAPVPVNYLGRIKVGLWSTHDPKVIRDRLHHEFLEEFMLEECCSHSTSTYLEVQKC